MQEHSAQHSESSTPIKTRKFYKKNKFRAKPTGQFKSKLESTIWKQLPHKRKDIKLQYETVRLDYVMKKTYIPDVVVDLPDGRRIFIEIKGWFRPEDRTKMIAAKAFNPDLDIRIVFAKDNPLRKGSKSHNSDWCRKHGFEYAVGEVPREWFQ